MGLDSGSGFDNPPPSKEYPADAAARKWENSEAAKIDSNRLMGSLALGGANYERNCVSEAGKKVWAPRIEGDERKMLVIPNGDGNYWRLGVEVLKVGLRHVADMEGFGKLKLPYLRFNGDGSIDHKSSQIFEFTANQVADIERLVKEAQFPAANQPLENPEKNIGVENQPLPEKFKIEKDAKLVSALWDAIPDQLREKILQRTESVVYPDVTVAGDGKVKRPEENGLASVSIGECLEPKYLAEIFYHEINHVAMDEDGVVSLEIRNEMKNAANVLYGELKSKGFSTDISYVNHSLINTLPIYILYPQALDKLSASYKGWDIAAKTYRELLGEIPSQKKERIFQEINNIKNKPDLPWPLEVKAISEPIRKGQEKGYLLKYPEFKEVEADLSPVNSR